MSSLNPKKVPSVKYFRKLSTNFNKEGVKWIIVNSPCYIGKKSNFFIQNFEIFAKNYFLTSTFIYSVFYQHICLILTNEFSIERLWDPLSHFSKKKNKRWWNWNTIGQPNQYGATPITSVSFTSKLAFYIHNIVEKNAKKLKVPIYFINMAIGSNRLEAFRSFVFIEKW